MNNVQTEVALLIESGGQVQVGLLGADYCLDYKGRHTSLPTILAGNSEDGYLCGLDETPAIDKDGNIHYTEFVYYVPVNG